MRFPLLDGLAEDDRRRVLASAHRRRFARGTTLFHEGDPAEAVHLVAAGRIAVQIVTAFGDVATLALVGPGEVLGEQALLGADHHRSASAQALEATETLVLHRDAFARLRRESRGVDDLLVAVLSARVERLSQRLVEAMYVPADERVRRRLAEATRLYATGGPGDVTVPLTQEVLASLAGTTRPTANRVLRDLEARGIVTLARGRVVVTAPGRLP